MTNTNVTSFRKNLFELLEQTVTYGEVVKISSKNGSAVLLSEQDYDSMLETLRLYAIPGMVESIKAAAAEPLQDCVPYQPDEAW